jgi:glycine oxidase
MAAHVGRSGVTQTTDVAVVGAGVIGTAIAWRCAQRGFSVTLIDPTPGAGASTTAAGMLAPVTELHFEGRELLALNLESARRYPAWVAELADLTGIDVGYRRCGTVQVAWDAADLAALRQLREFQASLGLSAQLLTGRELRQLEPSLVPGLPGGLLAADDHQIDNRRLHRALLAAAQAAGVTVHCAAVTSVGPGQVWTGTTGLTAGSIVLAAGAWTRRLYRDLPVRPVKGQTVRLRAEPGLLTRVVRGAVKGHPIYIVPRDDGELVLGASSEEVGFDARHRTGAVYEMLRDAQALLPVLNETEFVEVSTGFRPGSPDNAPLIGVTDQPGILAATGHFRNGVLLAPVTADAVAELIAGAEPDLLKPFRPNRFSQEAAHDVDR